jgi:hypothetical protein
MAGLAVLAARFGMAPGKATAAALLGQLVFMITGFLLVSAAIPGARAALPALPVDPAVIGLLLAAATVALIWVFIGTRFGHDARNWIADRFGERTATRLRTAFAIIDQARPRHAALWTAGYAVSWIVLAVAFTLYVAAFIPIGAHLIRYVGGIAAASYLLGYFSPAPAGFGAREIIMILFLDAIMPLQAATVIAILSRLWFTAGEVLPLLLIPLSGRTATVSAPAAAGISS